MTTEIKWHGANSIMKNFSNYNVSTLKSQVISSNIASIYYAILQLVIQERIRRCESNKRLKLLAKFHTFAHLSRAYHLDIEP